MECPPIRGRNNAVKKGVCVAEEDASAWSIAKRITSGS